MGLTLNYIDGQSPLDEDEKAGLRIKTISIKTELDEYEQINIQKAEEWTMTRREIKLDAILSEQFIKSLHKRMFSDVWLWAGEFRKSDKNIGADKFQIGIEIKKLIDDCEYWIQNKSFSEEEIAIRYKHRLVWIHPFANGNGRHSRMMADILIHHGFHKNRFTWGGGVLSATGDEREKYLSAIRTADKTMNYQPLLEFALSI
ncbi:MAG: mobile mystery protein B [Spirochaetes bacterium]|nr:mobile mystery protein B [Spirochaetota bacterium]